MEGHNTFGCLVNGQLFLPKGSLGQPNLHAEISTYNDTVSVSIYAGNTVSNKTLLISIYDSPGIQTGKSYDLKNSNFEVHFINYPTVATACTYEEKQNGTLTFSKFDIKNKIISGVFNFEINSANCKDSVNITEGRFDISEIII
jgi:hypothetical protein